MPPFVHLEDAVVFGDETLLTVLADNLLSNAVRYNDERQQVEVVLHETRSVVELSVLNTGPTIADAELDKLVKPLSQGSEPPTPDTAWGLRS